MSELHPLTDALEIGAVSNAAYGVCCDSDETGQFRYVAGLEATAKTEGTADRSGRTAAMQAFRPDAEWGIEHQMLAAKRTLSWSS